MPLIGFHASHEQISPRRLLTAVRQAEEAGFEGAMCSDHIAPWSIRQGHSGHAWVWLGAALEATSFSLGVVNAPGQRYHPAVIAQAIATLGEMYPGRFWAALGSGEALNEHVTGEVWPVKAERDERWLESASIIRRLIAGEQVSHAGHVTVDRARVWVHSDPPPDLIGAAVSEATARKVGGWADGLITVNQPVGTLRKVLAAFREGGGGEKPAYLQVHVSWAEDEADALEIAHDQWRTNVFPPSLTWELDTPEQFDAAAEWVRAGDLHESVLVSSDLGRHRKWLAEFFDLGFDGIYVHHVGQSQERFIEAFGDEVIPELT